MSNQYLTEEHYQKVNKKIKAVSLVIFLVGLLVGGGLIVFGLIKTNEVDRTNAEKTAEAEKTNAERAAAAQAEVDQKVEAANARLKEIESETAALNSQLSAKQYECDSMQMGAANWFADRSQCQNEASDISSQISNLEMEQFQLENAHYTVYYDKVSPDLVDFWGAPFYMIGAFIVIASSIASLSIWLVTKRRALKAYAIQQSMPVNQEAVQSYTPTISKAAGDIAGSVAEGISRGVKEGKK